MQWQDDHKNRAFARFALGGYQAAMAVCYPAANCQPHTGAFIFSAPMQTLEHGKNLLQVFFFKANAIVLHGQYAELIVWAGCGRRITENCFLADLIPVDELSVNFHDRCRVWSLKLQG